MKFTIPIKPTSKRTAEVRIFHGKIIARKIKNQRENEDLLKIHLHKFKPARPLEGPLFLRVKAYFPIVSTLRKAEKIDAEKENLYHSKKPDLDNLLKQINDCMQELEFFKNDSQICKIEVEKKYSKNPRWEIELNEI